MLFDLWVDKWIEIYKKPFIRQSTMELISYCLNHMIIFNDRQLSDIKGYELQQFLNSLGHVGNMQDKCRKYLNEIFEYAYRNRIIEFNPMLAIKMKSYKTTKTKVMTESDREFFIQSIKGKPYELLYLTYLYTGARKSEVLQDSLNVDFDNKILHIKGTKTLGSNRIIPLFDKLAKELSLVNDYKSYFNNYTPDYAYLRFRRHCNNIGLQGYNIRSLRSTFSNQCYVAGVREKTISSWLGHSGRTTTSRYYIDNDIISSFKSGQIAKEIEIVNSIL